jgi:hypothetical protein
MGGIGKGIRRRCGGCFCLGFTEGEEGGREEGTGGVLAEARSRKGERKREGERKKTREKRRLNVRARQRN